jgi:hypothetical protein
MARDLANDIYRLLLEKCESRCMDNHEDRKAVAEAVVDYLKGGEEDEAEELSSGTSE